MIMLKQPTPEAEVHKEDPLYHPGQIVRHRRYGRVVLSLVPFHR